MPSDFEPLEGGGYAGEFGTPPQVVYGQTHWRNLDTLLNDTSPVEPVEGRAEPFDATNWSISDQVTIAVDPIFPEREAVEESRQSESDRDNERESFPPSFDLFARNSGSDYRDDAPSRIPISDWRHAAGVESSFPDTSGLFSGW